MKAIELRLEPQLGAHGSWILAPRTLALHGVGRVIEQIGSLLNDALFLLAVTFPHLNFFAYFRHGLMF